MSLKGIVLVADQVPIEPLRSANSLFYRKMEIMAASDLASRLSGEILPIPPKIRVRIQD